MRARSWTLPMLRLLALCCLAAPPARADDPAAAFYQADAIVTGTDTRQRPWGFAQCLREVLVKVSGDPHLDDDPRVAALAAQADRFVASFGYVDMMAGTPRNDDQGSYDRPHRLTVRFDPAKIDGVLAALGDGPWRGARPVVVPVLLVRGRKPPPYLLSAENPAAAEQRAAFAAAAARFGMKARIPSEAELAGWKVTVGHFAYSEVTQIPGEEIVVGTLEWREALPGWVGAWRAEWRRHDHRWGISGVNYDAAFRNIVGGVVLLASGNGKPE